MVEKIKIEDLQCDCVRNTDSLRVVYMIYPLGVGFSEDWLETQAEHNTCSIVAIYVPFDKWNDYLTPWPEPGETRKAQPFAGEGSTFLRTIQTEVIPKAEEVLGIKDVAERDLIGVSLGGLFTLWEWMECDTFRSIACLSGSFWYMGFIDWFSKQTIPHKQGKAFFLLGTEEPKSHIKAYRSVGVNTEEIVTDLKKAGIDTTFEWVPGNHFANPMERAERAFSHLTD